MRRGLPTLVIAIGAAATLVIAWRVQRHARHGGAAADARMALVAATQALQRAPGDRAAAWDRAVALEGLGLSHMAADAFEMIAAQGDSDRSAAARVRARTLRDDERERARAPAPAASPAQCAPFAAALDAATRAQQRGEARGAEQQALDGFAAAQRAGCDPRDLPRRLLIVAAEAARSEHESGLADAYLGEARQRMP